MKITLKSVYIFVFLLLPALTYAAADTYYVTQNGNGLKDGRSLKNAWSVADFNSSVNWSKTNHEDKIDPGDTVYFSGTITTRLIPRGGGSASGGYVTLDGYAAGDDCDPLDADFISSDCYAAQAVLSGGKGGLRLTYGHDYIKIQDFRGTEGGSNLFVINYPTIAGTSDYIIVRRNYLHDANQNLFSFTRSSDSPRLYSNYITVENNRFVGYCGSRGAANGIGFNYVTNLIIRNNEFGGGPEDEERCDPDTDNVVEIHSIRNMLFEYNYVHDAYDQAGVATKEGTDQWNHIYRFNIFAGNTNAGLNIGGGFSNLYNMYIYGNLAINNARAGFGSYDTGHDHHYWSNLAISNGWQGFVIWNQSSRSNAITDIYYYNNTIAQNGDAASDNNRSGISVYGSKANKVTIKNNLLWNNRPSGLDAQYHQIYEDIPSITSDANTLFHKSATATWYSKGAIQPLADMVLLRQETNGAIADPGFTDPNGADNTYGTADDEYTLDGKNIDAGETLSDGTLPDYSNRITIQGTTYCNNNGGTCDELLSYSVAVDPKNTDWKTTPPTVKTTKQEDRGSWDRGAYVYGDLNAYEKPKIVKTVSAPSSFRTIN